MSTTDNQTQGAAKPELWTVAYCSHMSEPMSDHELADLAVCSTGKNRKLDVTGVLFFQDDRFVQVMEGDRAVVQALYERIKSDPRHERVITLKDGAILSRSFTGWAMRLVTLQFVSPGLRETLREALNIVAADDGSGPVSDPVVKACSAALVYGAMRTTPTTVAGQRAGGKAMSKAA